MITIWYNNTTACMIRPTPLISISQTPLRNRIGKFGSSYDITLNGTIIAHGGSPFYLADTDVGGTEGGNGPSGGHDGGGFSSTIATPASEAVTDPKALDSILSKQNAIRQLFARDGQKMEIQSVDGSTPRIVCYPSVESISFDEGTYVDICRFTITLTATTLLDSDGKVLADGGIFGAGGQTEQELIDDYGGFIEEYNDSWSLEVDESYGSTGGALVPRAYRITRNLTATGRNSHVDSSIGGDPSLTSVVKKEAWSQAKEFIRKYTGANSTIGGYPEAGPIASGFLDLEGYAGYNHIRTENIDKGAGTYAITDSWLMASGTDSALENYNASISSSTDGAFVSVSVDGSIKGVSSTPASGYGGSATLVTPYSKARTKYLAISNNGNFGVGSQIYKRVNSLTNLELNSQPASISIGSNEFTGEITYNVSFDNRPANVFTGVASEAISVNDTYPGDLYASIPVLGRTNGPVLQYIGGRTEYRRDVSIEIILDHTDIGYGNKRSDLMLRKPSINEPIRNELKNAIIQLSPASEPGIRKYFLSPPTESWNPKTGSYSLNLSWTYELDS